MIGPIPDQQHPRLARGDLAVVDADQPRALRGIKQPTLVVHGHTDLIIPTINGFTLQQHLPNAQLIIYPDSSHAPFYQYPDLFLAHASLFLDT
jgi:pimeloyl-ACP methyl ester carboxylesterase